MDNWFQTVPIIEDDEYLYMNESFGFLEYGEEYTLDFKVYHIDILYFIYWLLLIVLWYESAKTK